MVQNKSKKARFVTRRRMPPKRRFIARRRIIVQRPAQSNNSVGYLKCARLILGSLPITGLTSVLSMFDVAFDLIKKVIAAHDYFVGGYAMFTLSPADFLFNSPLLAKDGANYTFPGYPVSMKWVSLKICNTTQGQERSGRWAAVMIPYREIHDAEHYKKILVGLTFPEVAAMPYSKVATARESIKLKFSMVDKTMYCARPREIDEDIMVVFVIWDTGASADFSVAQTPSSFNCELEIEGGCLPHVIFGPQHRVPYANDVFKVHSITTGKAVRCHQEDGSITFESLDDYDYCD